MSAGLESFAAIADAAGWTGKHHAGDTLGFSIDASLGPFGANCGHFSDDSSHANENVDPTATVFVGWRLYASAAPAGAAVEMVEFHEGATVHVSVRWVSATGAVAIFRGSTQVAISAVGILFPTTWQAIRVRATISDTVGLVEVYVDGILVVSFSGDTRNAGTTGLIDNFQVNGVANSPQFTRIADYWFNTPFAGTTTGANATDLFTASAAHGLKEHTRIVFISLTGGTGLTAGTVYYVIASGLTSTQFKVSATKGGAAVNFTTDVTASVWSIGYLLDPRIEESNPNGNGATNDYTGSDGNSTDNYLLVDESTPNDADYTGSSTAGHRDLYEHDNLVSTTGDVVAVQVCARVFRTEAGARTMKLLGRTSGGTLESSAAKPVAISPLTISDYRNGDPDNVAYTISSFNSSQFGTEIV